MADLQVNNGLLSELESMGFSESRAKKALQSSGYLSIEAAISWLIDHDNDQDDEQVVEVPVNIDIEASDPSISEEVKSRAQRLSALDRDRARIKKEEEIKKLEREREKERIRFGKELAMAKRKAEETERERFIAQREREREEERRARDRVRQKLLQDKAERKGILRLGPESTKYARPDASLVDENEVIVFNKKQNPLVTKSVALPEDSTVRTELMKECLRSIRRQYKEDDGKVKRAFQTLLIYSRNVANNPDKEKFRKIRLGNPAFQARVGFCREGVQFLEFCGFERIGDQFLFLPRERVDMAVLKCAGIALQSALTNPFFGLLSK